MSDLERELHAYITWTKLPEPVREFRFHPTRRWRFDFAWPSERLAVEVEGGLHDYGRHQRPESFERDAEKYNEAALLGWRVLRVTASHISSGKAIEWITRALQRGAA